MYANLLKSYQSALDGAIDQLRVAKGTAISNAHWRERLDEHHATLRLVSEALSEAREVLDSLSEILRAIWEEGPAVAESVKVREHRRTKTKRHRPSGEPMGSGAITSHDEAAGTDAGDQAGPGKDAGFGLDVPPPFGGPKTP